MQALDIESTCPDCSKFMVDAGDEMVCPACGVVSEKEVVEPGFSTGRLPASGRQVLGSYMGSMGMTREERASKGLAGSTSKYEYLKMVSDFAGRDEGAAVACARMLERVGEPADKVEIRERYLIESTYREEILARDHYTCQACGYKQTSKPDWIPNRKAGETGAEYLYRRFSSSWGSSGQPRSLVVAHCARRYGEETYENRHKMENARTLCENCHNMETALHQIEEWLERKKTCPWLQTLE